MARDLLPRSQDCYAGPKHDKPWHGTVKGTTPGSSNYANVGNVVGQDARQPLAPIRGQGVQLTPASGGVIQAFRRHG